MKELVKNKIVSDKDFAQAEQSYENARLSYEALSKNHSAIGQSITAPIAGYVKSILVKEGDYVTIGQPLVSVTQNRRLFLRAVRGRDSTFSIVEESKNTSTNEPGITSPLLSNSKVTGT